MQNLKIRVNNEVEAEEVKRLAVKAGYTLDDLFGKKWSAEFCYLVLCENMSAGFGNEIMADGDKPLSIAGLRAMAEPKMKEYLMPSRNYEYILTDAREGLEPHAKDWIEIPKGAVRARFYPHDHDELEFENAFFQWWHDENNEWIRYENYSNTLEGSRVVWQREQDEPFLTPETTLNDQYAEIEQVRQLEIHGTVKAKPDFNFGAAQAIGGAKPRENKHYFIDVSDVDEVDFYEIAKRYNVTDPAIQHILKKCLAIGNRGHKDLETDLKDILKTAKRALQINGFGE